LFQSNCDTSYDASNPFDAAGLDKMTKLCFGGSFNPLHTGHLLVARAVAEAAGFERVVLVPSAQPPHKPNAADLATAAHRLGMCQAVAKCDPFFEIETLELERSGPSYTIDSARELKRRGWPKVPWLIGADMVQILPKWHQATDLLDEVDFVIAQRPGFDIDWQSLPEPFRLLKRQIVLAPSVQISASEIRRRIGEGKPIRYLVPPEVEQYIADHRLYLP
jgi:nicotinate-nucleotide adenylyltransferase